MAFTLRCAIRHLPESMQLQVYLMTVVKQPTDKKSMDLLIRKLVHLDGVVMLNGIKMHMLTMHRSMDLTEHELRT